MRGHIGSMGMGVPGCVVAARVRPVLTSGRTVCHNTGTRNPACPGEPYGSAASGGPYDQTVCCRCDMSGHSASKERTE